jgi:hypothetical protein
MRLGVNGKKKYSKLRKECEYDTLTFYEVNINAYDTEVIGILGEKPEDPSLLKAYSYVEAAYIEGKLGYDSKKADNHSMYNPSKLDGYFYDYFNSEKK